ncbi:MAG: hypothetical protein GDA48_12890 [Hormoscilla sp. GM102CHS1]|nr:hypothetical protein [Hormoscilla sp. GM102CHS1]
MSDPTFGTPQTSLLNANDYAALKALYTSTSWKVEGWDFSSATPPDVSIVKTWHGVVRFVPA